MSLPSMMVFPIVNGISLLGGVVLAVIIFKEKLSGAKILSFILGFTVMVITLLRRQ